MNMTYEEYISGMICCHVTNEASGEPLRVIGGKLQTTTDALIILPDYASDWGAMGDLVRILNEKEVNVAIMQQRDHKKVWCEVTVHPRANWPFPTGFASESTPQMALCQAALRSINASFLDRRLFEEKKP